MSDAILEVVSPRDLHEELGGLRMSTLRKRAASAGIAEDGLEAIDDAEDPKAAAIDAIMGAEAGSPFVQRLVSHSQHLFDMLLSRHTAARSKSTARHSSRDAIPEHSLHRPPQWCSLHVALPAHSLGQPLKQRS